MIKQSWIDYPNLQRIFFHIQKFDLMWQFRLLVEKTLSDCDHDLGDVSGSVYGWAGHLEM